MSTPVQDFSLDGSHAESPGEESSQVDGTTDENAIAYAPEEAAASSFDQSADVTTDTTPTPVDGVHAAEDAKRDAV